jgi:hypothetical protein
VESRRAVAVGSCVASFSFTLRSLGIIVILSHILFPRRRRFDNITNVVRLFGTVMLERLDTPINTQRIILERGVPNHHYI